MAIINIKSKARCKDCRFCQYFFKGKAKRHRCINPKSNRYWGEDINKTISLNDFVCDKWEL